MNNNEREQWVHNSEGLYNWWRQSKLPLRKFIKENRAMIDEIILAEINKPPGEQMS